jgi:NTP pyrophosphatase (non-canonical NTP hydrolase)
LLAQKALCGGGEGTVEIRSAQQRAWGNKTAKGFNTTDVPMEFCLLHGEISEAFDAWRKGRPGVGEELADTAIYLLALAEMLGIDLQDEIEAKMTKNASRVCRRLPNGVLVKAGAASLGDVQAKR